MCNLPQFRSISNELYGTQDHHAAIRRRAVSYIASHREDFECFLGEDFDHYCRNMTASGTWGDELTLVRHNGGGAGAGLRVREDESIWGPVRHRVAALQRNNLNPHGA